MNVYDSNNKSILEWLDKVERCDLNYIRMQDFLNFLHKEDIIETPFYLIRCSIIQHIIGMKEYNVIRKRIRYYTSENILDKTMPKEGCIDNIVRHLITHKPHPFYYDYKPSNRRRTSFIDYNSTLIEVRKRFGYSTRPTKESATVLNSAASLRSLKNKSNSTNQLISSANYRSAISNHNSSIANKLSTTMSDNSRILHNNNNNESIIKKSTVVPLIYSK